MLLEFSLAFSAALFRRFLLVFPGDALGFFATNGALLYVISTVVVSHKLNSGALVTP
jgi:hypothetical protein